MSRMGVDGNQLENAGSPILLPIEHEAEVNGIIKKIRNRYTAEIVSAREHKSKAGKMALKLQLAIDYKVPEQEIPERIYIEDYLSYEPKALWRLAGLVGVFDMDPKNLDTDDFEGQLVIVTINHQSFTLASDEAIEGEGKVIWRNSIAAYLERAHIENPPDPSMPAF